MKSRIVQSADNDTAAFLGAVANLSVEAARRNVGEFTWPSSWLTLIVEGKSLVFETKPTFKLQEERGTGPVKVYIPKIWSVEVSGPRCKKYTLCYTLGALTLLGL